MESDGFTLVKRGGRLCRKKAPIQPEGTLEDIDATMNKMMSSDEVVNLGSWVTKRVASILDGNSLERIFVVGNGHFDSTWTPGAHQLAVALQLQQNFGSEEPFCSKSEISWLSDRENVSVRSESDMFLPVIPSENILVIIIHGVHELINDFLWFNWKRVRNAIFICNDYSSVDLIGGCPTINSRFEALNAFRSSAISCLLPRYIPDPSHFAFTSLMYLKSQEELQKISDNNPIYVQ